MSWFKILSACTLAMGANAIYNDILTAKLALHFPYPSAMSGRNNAVPRDHVKEWNTKLNLTNIVTSYGYPFEKHENVKTKDGYLLEIHRIPHGTSSIGQKGSNKIPVLIMHGLLCSSSDFFLSGPEKSLAYIAADAGYDVWLGNLRGNTWSRNHAEKNPDQDESYWNFSFDEMGLYDLPTIIDYILDVTKQEKLFYIGHSQGSTVLFVLLSELPQYNDKIIFGSALAPAAFMTTSPSMLIKWLANEDFYRFFTQTFGIKNELARDNFPFSLFATCTLNKYTLEFCLQTLISIVGGSREQINLDLYALYLKSFPSSVSVKQIKHYVQLKNKEEFQKFDYGPNANYEKYKQNKPPTYKLSNIQIPIGIFYGNDDKLISQKDVFKLSSRLPNVANITKVPYKKFGHLDFIYSKFAADFVYRPVLQLMKQYLVK